MRIAFWNVHKNNSIGSIIRKLIMTESIDLMIMAEYCKDIGSIINMVDEGSNSWKAVFTGGCDRIKILSSRTDIEPGVMNEYYAMVIVNNDMIICSLHLPSNIYNEAEKDRQIIVQDAKEQIELYCKKKKIYKVIVIGDLNENPYEGNILGASGFAGIPVAELAPSKRKIRNKNIKMYYNPMWRFFGDEKLPYGTYYCKKGHDTPFWNIYDQVLLSPSLVDCFVSEELRIITKIGEMNLTNERGIPDHKNYSDHFPIVLELKEG